MIYTDSAIDLYIGEDYMDVLAEGEWQRIFKAKPEVFTREEKRKRLDTMKGVALGSDAFFPLGGNNVIEQLGEQFFTQPFDNFAHYIYENASGGFQNGQTNSGQENLRVQG